MRCQSSSGRETDMSEDANEIQEQPPLENETSEAEKQPAHAAKKKPSGKVIAIIAVVVVAAIAAGAFWFVNYQMPHNEAAGNFEAAAAGLEERNAELDAAIADLQALMGSEVQPLDSATLDAASAAIGEAQGAKDSVPEMPSDTDEINAAASEIEGMGQYAAQFEAIEAAKTNLQNSIEQRKLVTNPTEQFVIERLTGLPNITGIEAATETNDPNGNLNKDGGYTAAVFFSSDLVDQSTLYADPECTGIPAIGTDGGGCIEVFANEEDAEQRNTYLGAFDGGILSSGSHTVVGTCVVRTSSELTASQQDALEASIIESLTRLG
jgi:flagellar basal body-associated protein FliL